MHEEQQPQQNVHQIFENLKKRGVIDFPQGGNLNDIPKNIVVDGEEVALAKDLVNDVPQTLNVSALFTPKLDHIEYVPQIETGEPDLELLQKVLFALQQELKNATAAVSTNIYFVNRKVEVSAEQLSEAKNLPEAVEIIESLNKNTDAKANLLSTALYRLEVLKSFFESLLAALAKTSNLEGFNLELLTKLEIEVDKYIQRVDFENNVIYPPEGTNEEPEIFEDGNRAPLFKKMSQQVESITEAYKGADGVEDWFYQFLALTASTRVFDMTQEFVAFQLQDIAAMLNFRLGVGDRLMKSDRNQPPTEYNVDDEPREDQ